MIPAIQRWQMFARSRLSARLLPLYATLVGAALGALVADRVVRSMWHHAIFTGANQWRTVALLLVVFWLAIGAVAALAVLGPPDAEPPAAVSDDSAEPTDWQVKTTHDRAPS